MKSYAMDVDKGKNIKNPFPKRNNKAEGVLELIHSDVCGPIPSSSISGLRYSSQIMEENIPQKSL
jgi:hypothetical protein